LDNIKRINIHTIRVPEEEERKEGTENIFEGIIAKNFPNLKKETRHPGSRSTDSSKQGEPKKVHTKTHNN